MSRDRRARIRELLAEVVSVHLPGEVALVQAFVDETLTKDTRERLCSAIALELIESGLGEDDEPNARGLELEMLLDEVNRSCLGV